MLKICEGEILKPLGKSEEECIVKLSKIRQAELNKIGNPTL